MSSRKQLSLGADQKRWEELAHEQTLLFNKLAARNAELEAAEKDHQRDLRVFRQALDRAEEEKDRLKKDRGSGGGLNHHGGHNGKVVENPLILCVIDGDANLFAPAHLTASHEGGKQAGRQLTQALQRGNTDARVWVMVFLDMSGVAGYLAESAIASKDQFEGFVQGFNSTSPLFCMADIGSSKDAMDHKLKETLRAFAPLPQVEKFYFCGAPEKQYKSQLRFLENDGHMDKMALLRGSDEPAADLVALGLDVVPVHGLFYSELSPTQKEDHNSTPSHVSHQTNHTAPPKAEPVVDGWGAWEEQPTELNSWNGPWSAPTSPKQDPKPYYQEPAQSSTHSRSTRSKPQSSNESPQPTSRAKLYLDPDLPISKHRPAPCNFYYLATCRQGSKCQYSHDYVMTPDQVELVRVAAKKSPCSTMNRNQTCSHGDNCCLGHYCPNGPSCYFYKQGKCKFLGDDMHNYRPLGPGK